MEFYKLADATYLLDYYKEKLVGQKISHKSDALITHLEIDDWDNDKYRLMARAGAHTAVDVCDVVKLYPDMAHPVSVLNQRTS